MIQEKIAAGRIKNSNDEEAEAIYRYANAKDAEERILAGKESKKYSRGKMNSKIPESKEEPSDLYYLMRNKLGYEIPKKRKLEWKLSDKKDSMTDRDKETLNKITNK